MTSTLCRRLLTLRISQVVSAQARPIYTVKCPPIRMEWKLKLHWEEPKPVPVYNPFKSGDLSSFPSNMDTKIPILEIQPAADVLAKSDPVTQRLLSLEYAPRREVFKLHLNELIKKVQRHRLDFDSEEVKIAKLTAHIRRAQYDIFETSTGRFNYKRICIVRGQVQKRRRLLKELRFLDYRRFEWVLEQLNIRFQNYPAVTIRIDRRQALRRLFSEHRQRVHMERRKELHQKFLESQKEFLEEKIEKLKWIAEEEKELRLPSTVSEKDIEAAQERAKAYVPFELSPPPQWPGPGQWPYDTFFVRSDFVVKKTSRIFAHFQTLETYDVK